MIRKKILVPLVSFLICVFAFNVHAEWKVKVKEWAIIKGDVVCLKDIAYPTPYCSKNQWDHIKDVKLWNAPAKGKQVFIDQERLQGLLRLYLGDFVDFFIIPKQIVIQRGGKIILKNDLYKEIKKKVKSIFYKQEFKIRNLMIPKYLFLKDRDVSIKCKIEPKPRPGSNTVIFEILDPYGEIKKRIAGSFFLDVWEYVVCAARPLNRGDIIKPTDITLRRKNLAYIPFKLWDGKGGPWRVKRPIGIGRVICMNDIEPNPLISKNKKVILMYDKGFVFLRVTAKAIEEGRLGDIIKVLNLQSKKIVFAKVVDKDTVVVP